MNQSNALRYELEKVLKQGKCSHSSLRDTFRYFSRPTSAKTYISSDCNRSVHSAGEEMEPARVSRPIKKDNQAPYRITRSVTNVASASDKSNFDSTPGHLRKVDNHLFRKSDYQSILVTHRSLVAIESSRISYRFQNK